MGEYYIGCMNFQLILARDTYIHVQCMSGVHSIHRRFQALPKWWMHDHTWKVVANLLMAEALNMARLQVLETQHANLPVTYIRSHFLRN